jgi:hypothetical protein
MVVCGIKTSSDEHKIMWLIRSIYYKMISYFSISNIDQVQHFTGFGLFDEKFLNIVRDLHDPLPTMRGFVAEYCPDAARVEFHQSKRRAGKTNNGFAALFGNAMVNITSYTTAGLRISSFSGIIISIVSVIIGIVYLILKIINWNNFAVGVAPLLIGTFFLGGVQLFFIGMLGEYILSMNTRIKNRPLVIEAERINFQTTEENR